MWTLLALVLTIPIVWALSGAHVLPAFAIEPLDAASGWLTAQSAQLLPANIRPAVEGASAVTLTEASALPSSSLLVALSIGGFFAFGPTARLANHLATMVHEFGHALVAALLGGHVHRLITSRDGSGLAFFSFPSGRARIRRAIAGLAGYLAPGVLAVASVRTAISGFGSVWLAYLALLLAVMLLFALRSWWAAFVALALTLGAVATLSLGLANIPTLTVAGLAGMLAVAGVRDSLMQVREVSAGRRPDAVIIADQTGIPAGLTAGLHVLAAGALTATVLWLSLQPV